jgi:hypothetical protein
MRKRGQDSHHTLTHYFSHYSGQVKKGDRLKIWEECQRGEDTLSSIVITSQHC